MSKVVQPLQNISLENKKIRLALKTLDTKMDDFVNEIAIPELCTTAMRSMASKVAPYDRIIPRVVRNT